jgi:hypothetical protein
MSAVTLADKAKDLVRALRAAHEDNAALRAERTSSTEVRALQAQNLQHTAINARLERENTQIKQELAALKSEHELLRTILEDEWEFISRGTGPGSSK